MAQVVVATDRGDIVASFVFTLGDTAEEFLSSAALREALEEALRRDVERETFGGPPTPQFGGPGS